MPEDFDLVVRGGVVVTPAGRAVLDVYVRDGRIAALEPPHHRHKARRVLDADSLLVLPGMVDTHVHLMDPGDDTREDFPSGSLAAACGGVTTIIEHTHGWPVTDVARLADKRAHLRGRSVVDYGLGAHVWAEQHQDLNALWQGGVSFFKVFTCATHGVPAVGADLLIDVFSELAEMGAPALVHCEDDLITAAAERRLRAMGRNDPGVVVEWRSREAELVAVGTVALLARLTGATVTVAHVSSAEALAVLQSEQRLGSPAVGETCPQYLFLDEAEIYEQGALRKFTPPARIRSSNDREAMWAAFNSGDVHHLSTDHAPSTVDQKLTADIWEAHFGLPGLDSTLALMLDAALDGRTSLERLVAAYAWAPARRYHLPRKGRISPGADADLVLVDPSARRTLTNEAVRSRAGWTPYAGKELRGEVIATVLRGTTVVDHGELIAEPQGAFLPGAGGRRAGPV